MNVFFLLLACSVSHAADLRVLDHGGTYEALASTGATDPNRRMTKFACADRPVGLMGLFCKTESGAMVGQCDAMTKAFENSCFKKIMDSDATKAAVDQSIRGSVDSLTIAVKDSYRLLVTSEEFRRMVREEVKKALVEQAANN